MPCGVWGTRTRGSSYWLTTTRTALKTRPVIIFMYIVPDVLFHSFLSYSCIGTQVIAYHDTRHLPRPSIRHSDCGLMLPGGATTCCEKCSSYRRSLEVMLSRKRSKSVSGTTSSSHVNYRYLSTPEKVDRLHSLHQDSHSQQRRVQRLRARITEMTASKGLSLDTETTSDLSRAS